jgi:hypothetical protein
LNVRFSPEEIQIDKDTRIYGYEAVDVKKGETVSFTVTREHYTPPGHKFHTEAVHPVPNDDIKKIIFTGTEDKELIKELDINSQNRLFMLNNDNPSDYILEIIDELLSIVVDDGRPTEEARDGAYFGKRFIPGTEFSKAHYIEEYAVIYGDRLSLFFDTENCDVYRFSLNGDYYTEETPLRSWITFKFSGDVLTVNLISQHWGTTKMRLKLNPSFGLSEEGPVQAFPPENVRVTDHNDRGKNYSYIEWDFFESSFFECVPTYSLLCNNGILGAGLEIKYAGAEDFTAVSKVNYIGGPAWFFGITIYSSGLPQGTHTARLKHLGGPFVQYRPLWENGKIRLSLDSQPLYFKVTVDANGEIKTEEIRGIVFQR